MITVAGLSPSVDITYVVDHLELGAIHRPTASVRCAGGKPLNLTRAAAALGAEVAVVAVLGGWTGDWLAAELERVDIGVRRVSTPALTRTCVSVAAADSGELTEVYEYAEPIPDDVWSEVVSVLADVLAHRPGWLAISGGPPRGLAPGALAELAEVARAVGVRVAVDTHGPGLPALLATRPELVKINRAEAEEALGATGSLVELARAVQERTSGTVVLTDGAHGSLGLPVAGEPITAPAPTLRGRFPVGSGDCYLGGLLTALDRGDELPTALRLAAAAGVANAQLPGPGVFDLDVVAELVSATSPTSRQPAHLHPA